MINNITVSKYYYNVVDFSNRSTMKNSTYFIALYEKILNTYNQTRDSLIFLILEVVYCMLIPKSLVEWRISRMT